MAITPGPFRPASKLGAFITMVAFTDIYGLRNSVSSDKKQVSQRLKKIILGGYTFDCRCDLTWGDDGQVKMGFHVFLVSGDWDNYVDWPFVKKVTAIVTHLRDEQKDVRLPIRTDHQLVNKKPTPGKYNHGYLSQEMSWQQVEDNGFIANNTLYVNIEFA
ncbi:hypothetical protein MTO96_029996 [Rhipicephalus appendiculatus]